MTGGTATAAGAAVSVTWGAGVSVGAGVGVAGSGVGVGSSTLSTTVLSVWYQVLSTRMPAESFISLMGLSKMAVKVQVVLLGASTASVTPLTSVPTSSSTRTPLMALSAVKVNTVFTPVCTAGSGVSNLISLGGSYFFKPKRPSPPSTTRVVMPLTWPKMPVAFLGIRKWEPMKTRPSSTIRLMRTSGQRRGGRSS